MWLVNNKPVDKRFMAKRELFSNGRGAVFWVDGMKGSFIKTDHDCGGARVFWVDGMKGSFNCYRYPVAQGGCFLGRWNEGKFYWEREGGANERRE